MKDTTSTERKVNNPKGGEETPLGIAEGHAQWAIDLLRQQILYKTPIAADGEPLVEHYPVYEAALISLAYSATALVRIGERIANQLEAKNATEARND